MKLTITEELWTVTRGDLLVPGHMFTSIILFSPLFPTLWCIQSPRKGLFKGWNHRMLEVLKQRKWGPHNLRNLFKAACLLSIRGMTRQRKLC